MGLYDREYMNDVPPEGRYYSTQPVWILIAVNVLIYLLDMKSSLQLYTYFCEKFHFYQLLTAGFVHADFWHLFCNMYGLYLFGTMVAQKIRPERFYILYLVGVLTGNLLYLAVNFDRPGILLGASGAVCAVMMGAAMLEPDRRFALLFFPTMPLKTTTLVLCYAALEMLLEISHAEGTVAHLAHLGGFAGGYLYLKIVLKDTLAWDPLRIKKKVRVRPTAQSFVHASDRPVSPQELDALLDKISREGINSLTPEEYERLRQAREEMRRR